MDFRGQTVIVTGGSLGIGLAAAKRFASLGADVVLADINREHGVRAQDEITRAGRGRALFVETDVSCLSSVTSMVDQTLEAFGRLDVLVNNAGVYTKGDVIFATEADWDRLMDINLKGAFLCMKACVPAMISSAAGGVVVNVASEAGLVGIRGQVVYNVSKAGMIALTRSSAVDLAGRGVRVNCICPGTTETPLVLAAVANDPDPVRARRALETCRPLGRLGHVDEIAHGIVFLSSKEAGYATGAVLSMDGGYT
ncbi:MAG: SDR family oxidoreductase, partial [Firmicutes bacterium]|nr:SDR family oxidoreductase [Bacillota bacterium]